jgi:predicted aldo/keto reductase-like oxidoreductase
MEFRNFGKLDWKTSVLGFGAMRLPTTDGDPRSANIDEAESTRMMRHAIDNGVNYVDTAYIYHGGNSERVVGAALRDGYRDKVHIADKSPVWLIREAGDFDRLLNEQLQRLQTDHIDFYLLHGLNKKAWENVVLKFDLIEKANAAIRDGRIRHLGFSFHDDYAGFEQIVNGYDQWTFCQIQYNYMDTENQAGLKGLQLAASKGLAVVVMEPLLGGRLANPPAAIRKLFDEAARGNRAVKGRTPAELALQWIWDQPEVSLILSGMSNMPQLEANLKYAANARVGSFGSADHELISRLRAAYFARTPIPCTKCGYCMPCPNGVNIPRNFELYNDAHLHDDLEEGQFVYRAFLPELERASACVECRECEDLCPQKIPISEWMPKVGAAMGAAK